MHEFQTNTYTDGDSWDYTCGG